MLQGSRRHPLEMGEPQIVEVLTHLVVRANEPILAFGSAFVRSLATGVQLLVHQPRYRWIMPDFDGWGSPYRVQPGFFCQPPPV